MIDLCFLLPPLAGPLVKVGDGGNFNTQQVSVSVCECVREKERQRDREQESPRHHSAGSVFV